MTAYFFQFRFDLGQACAPVGELANQLNSNLARMVCDEKVAITAELPLLTLTSTRELTEIELTTVKTVISAQMQSAFPTWKVALVSVRRQSGNVQQSVSQ